MDNIDSFLRELDDDHQIHDPEENMRCREEIQDRFNRVWVIEDAKTKEAKKSSFEEFKEIFLKNLCKVMNVPIPILTGSYEWADKLAIEHDEITAEVEAKITEAAKRRAEAGREAGDVVILGPEASQRAMEIKNSLEVEKDITSYIFTDQVLGLGKRGTWVEKEAPLTFESCKEALKSLGKPTPEASPTMRRLGITMKYPLITNPLSILEPISGPHFPPPGYRDPGVSVQDAKTKENLRKLKELGCIWSIR